MKHRERFEKTISHKEADRPPFDFCGTPQTGCYSEVIEGLSKHYSISADNEAEAAEKLQEIFDTDFRRVGTLFEPPSDYLDNTKVSQGLMTDSWGITKKFQGLYWDNISFPFKDKDLDELKQYRWPSAKDIDRKQIEEITEAAKRYYNDTDYVVVAEHPVYGYFELGCWMFGFDDFLYRMLAEPEITEWFFESYHKYVADVLELYYGAIGDYIHVTTSGDDFGTQNAPFISPELFAEQIKPWYKKRIDLTKQMTKAKYFHHTCGSVFRLLPDIIDMGVDILNPIQPGVLEMEPERLKENFGDKITFWGGIDEQGLLSSSTPEIITSETRRVNGILGKNGGWVLAPSHNIQPDVPPENVIAMYNALK